MSALDGEILPPARITRASLSTAEEQGLGEQIRAEHEAGERSLKEAVRHFRRCGEKLLQAKGALGHGSFAHFLKSNVKLHPRTAQRYMMLAREMARLSARDATRVSQLSLRDAIGELSRLSHAANKLGAPALGKALAAARTEPIKAAVTYQKNLMIPALPSAGPAGWTRVEIGPPSPAPTPTTEPRRYREVEYALLDVLQTFAREEPGLSLNGALEVLNETYCRLQEVGDALLRPPGLDDDAPLEAPVAHDVRPQGGAA